MDAFDTQRALPFGRAAFRRVFSIALDEMAGIVAPNRKGALRFAARGAMALPAAAIASRLVALDQALARGTLRDGALFTLRQYGVTLRVEGPPFPAAGATLVIANHPGLFDALALFAAVGRDDLATLAAHRTLFDALPNVSRRLVPISAGAGAMALRSGCRHLARGGALLHFPAGEIEPDPRIALPGEPLLGRWKPGLEVLVRAAARAGVGAVVVPAIVSGVISRRARSVARRIAGRDGLTDALVPLVQLTLPGFADVDVRVHLGEPALASEIAADPSRLRDRLERLSLAARASVA